MPWWLGVSCSRLSPPIFLHPRRPLLQTPSRPIKSPAPSRIVVPDRCEIRSPTDEAVRRRSPRTWSEAKGSPNHAVPNSRSNSGSQAWPSRRCCLRPKQKGVKNHDRCRSGQAGSPGLGLNRSLVALFSNGSCPPPPHQWCGSRLGVPKKTCKTSSTLPSRVLKLAVTAGRRRKRANSHE